MMKTVLAAAVLVRLISQTLAKYAFVNCTTDGYIRYSINGVSESLTFMSIPTPYDADTNYILVSLEGYVGITKLQRDTTSGLFASYTNWLQIFPCTSSISGRYFPGYTGVTFLIRYAISGGGTVITSSPSDTMDLTGYGGSIRCMDTIPTTTRIIFGGRLTITDYTNMTNVYGPVISAVNFKYVICIDASTCIAADDSSTGAIYYDLSGIAQGGTLWSVKSVNSSDTQLTTGLAGSQALQVMILSTKKNVYIISLADTSVRKTIYVKNDDVLGMAASFGSDLRDTTVLLNIGNKTLGYMLMPLTGGQDETWSNYFVHAYPSQSPSLYFASGDGKYLAMMYGSDIILYEKKPCHTSCEGCFGTNATSCLTCTAPKLVDTVSSTCAPCASNGHIAYAYWCIPCDSPCANCQYLTTYCTSCVAGYCLSGGGTCVTEASAQAASKFRNPTTTACTNCAAGCVTCSSLTSCTQCTNGYYLSGGICNLCNSTCATCSSSSVCITCKTNNYLGANNTCTSCSGSFFVDLNNACQPCGPTCLTCNSATNCLTCNTSLKVSSTNGTCDACGVGYLVPNTMSKCFPCDANCLTCSMTASHCTSCASGKYLSVNDSTCVACNTPGVFPDNITNDCRTCDPNCQTCVTYPTFCLTCSAGNSISFQDHSCMTCGDGYFIDGGMCKSCSSSCAKCSQTSTNCTACTGSDVLSASNSTCGPCNSGYYVDSGLCKKCDNNCLTCGISSDRCLSCNFSLYLSDFNNTCTACGDGFYVGGDFICRSCDSSCKTCSGTNTHCDSCPNNTYLMQAKNACVDCDQSGQGIEGIYCRDCTLGWNCDRCDGNASSCTKCLPSYYIMTADNNKCGNNCNATGGSYIETVSGVSYCKQCDSSCAECSSGGSSNCTKCAGTLQLIGGECKPCSPHCANCTSLTQCVACEAPYLMTQSSTCIDAPTCKQARSFVSGSACQNCSANCKSCFGSAASCTSCIAGQYLSATNTCVPCTENGYYHNSTNCLQCDSSCLTCNGSTSTDCLSCQDQFVLSEDSSCQNAPPLRLLSASFKSDMSLATFSFDSALHEKSTNPSVGLYTCSEAELKGLLTSTQGLPGPNSNCKPFESWSVSDMTVEGAHIRVKLAIEKSLDNGILVLRAPEKAYWQSTANSLIRYPEDYLIVENVTVIKSALDGMMDSAAAPATAAMTTVQLVVMTVSLPQAFILMKVLQTLDYYIYIDCQYPSNFAKFLAMITNSAFDYLPNFFEMLVDNDGLPLYERFAEYGMKVHIFANLGQIYSVAIILGALKLIFLLLKRLWSRAGKLYSMVSPDLFFGIFESYHLDSVLSVLIFIANRERIDNREDAVKYLVIVFVSLFSLFMISMYLFMGYTVSRLTDSYFKHAVVEVKHMKAESWRFLLEDKNMHGNIFQRHFNLIQLFKDIVFAALLYALYYKPLVLIILLTLIQAVFTTGCLVYTPYAIDLMNKSLKATQSLYLMLDLFFVLLLGWGDQLSERTRYYFVGFAMIVLVLLILGCNIGFSLYSTYKQLQARYRKNKSKKAILGEISEGPDTSITKVHLNLSFNSVAPTGDETGIKLNYSNNKNNKSSQPKAIVTKLASTSVKPAIKAKVPKRVKGPTDILELHSTNKHSVVQRGLTSDTLGQGAGRIHISGRKNAYDPQSSPLGISSPDSRTERSAATNAAVSTSREKQMRFEYFNKKLANKRSVRQMDAQIGQN